jgi:hypothetical protein
MLVTREVIQTAGLWEKTTYSLDLREDAYENLPREVKEKGAIATKQYKDSNLSVTVFQKIHDGTTEPPA